MYTYVHNNPVNFTDPTGHRECEGAESCDGGESETTPCADDDTLCWLNAAIPTDDPDYKLFTPERRAELAGCIDAYNSDPFGTGSSPCGTKLLWGETMGVLALGASAAVITIQVADFGDAGEHAADGGGGEWTVDRAGAAGRRSANLRGMETKDGYDRDEWPPAVVKESRNADVRYVTSSSNRRLGAWIGRRLRGVKNGETVRFEIKKNNDED